MKIGPMKTFLYYFNLRQGTILVALLQLLLSIYIFIFSIVGLAHLADIQEIIARDTEDALEREALEEITSKHINSHRMALAHHNADEELYMMYCDMAIVSVHFFSTLALFLGAVLNKRILMAPWMMVMMTIIVALIISLFLVQEDCPFIAEIGGRANLLDRILVSILTCFCIYMWLVVYSYYRSLEIKKGLIHEIHSSIKSAKMSNSAKPSNNKSWRYYVSLPQPYNV